MSSGVGGGNNSVFYTNVGQNQLDRDQSGGQG